MWFLKTRALTLKSWIDDTEVEEEGVAEMLLDENATAQAPRPGTSFNGPRQGTAGPNQAIRPVSSSGRPLTGFMRPGTSARPGTGAASVDQAFRGSRPGTSRPVTALGRCVLQSLLLLLVLLLASSLPRFWLCCRCAVQLTLLRWPQARATGYGVHAEHGRWAVH